MIKASILVILLYPPLGAFTIECNCRFPLPGMPFLGGCIYERSNESRSEGSKARCHGLDRGQI